MRYHHFQSSCHTHHNQITASFGAEILLTTFFPSIIKDLQQHITYHYRHPLVSEEYGVAL